MDWQAVNAISQVIAAVGVILTLVYLGAQIRQNTRAIRRSAYQELLNHIAQVNVKLIEDRSLCELSIKLRSGLDKLEEPDRMRVLAWFGTVFRHYQNAYNLLREGVITQEHWNLLSATIERNLASTGAREMWDVVRSTFTPEFQAMIDARIRAMVAPRDP